MSTANLSVIVNGVVDLAAISVFGGLVFARRIVFAATPKPPARPAAKQPDPAGGQQDGHGQTGSLM